MKQMIDQPLFVFVAAMAAQWLAAFVGETIRRRKVTQAEWEDFNVVRTTALTLLALIIGFTFSMAVSRYDLRKSYEEAEANAIGTEFVRADLAPAADAAKIRTLLASYLKQRIAFYETGESAQDAGRAMQATQTEMWASAARVANAAPTPTSALLASGMNDVLNAQGYAQAAWWNRIPLPAWMLMALVAIACNLLMGYGEKTANRSNLVILPVIVAIAFALIADIDSPRGGFIQVQPQNLIALQRSLAS
ncbi:MAG: hypothetical protein U1E28_01610 [Beijerinckiaceae bacterium]